MLCGKKMEERRLVQAHWVSFRPKFRPRPKRSQYTVVAKEVGNKKQRFFACAATDQKNRIFSLRSHCAAT